MTPALRCYPSARSFPETNGLSPPITVDREDQPRYLNIQGATFMTPMTSAVDNA